MLKQAAIKIQALKDSKVQSTLSASTGILSTLLLDEELVSTILGRDIMLESALYQSIKEEGREEGREEGAHQLALQILSMQMET